jgi:hypothetical protein
MPQSQEQIKLQHELDAVEVTQEMENYGIIILEHLEDQGVSSTYIVREIYKAMEMIRRRNVSIIRPGDGHIDQHRRERAE